MTDLQCPARIFLLRPGGPPVASVADALRDERLAAVLGPDEDHDLAELADRYRGEAVLVEREHPYPPPLVLVELDADGTRVSPWETPGS